MERIDLCARISQLVRAEDGATAAKDAVAQGALVRAVVDDVLSAYTTSGAETSPVAAVDEMVLLGFHRLMITSVRVCGYTTQERAFSTLLLLLNLHASRLTEKQVIELLQTCVLFLPTPDIARDETSTDKRAPEDLHVAVLRALEALLCAEAAPRAMQMLIRSQDHINFLAYMISSLLQVAERERHRDLATLAIQLLIKTQEYIHSPGVLRQFFPGLTMGMWKAITAPMQSSKVVTVALECLSLAVSRCIGGDVAANMPPRYSIASVRELQAVSSQPSSIAAPTRDQWLATSADKFDLILSQLLAAKAVSMQSWRVRLAVSQLCRVIVLECRDTLPEPFLRSLEELMVLSTHAIAEVADAASATLTCLQTQLSADEWLVLEPRFVERFHIHLSTLEVKAGTDLESVSAHLMEILIGYLRFHGTRLRDVLDGSMGTLLKSLCRVVAFDAIDVDLVRYEQVRAVQGDAALALPYFPKRFCHFHEETSVRTATQLLQVVGTVSTLDVVVDVAFAQLQADSTSRIREHETVLVILNECLRAQIGRTEASVQVHLVGRILDDLFALPVWSSSRQSEKNVLALMAECVGVCVDLVGSHFDQFLLHALYPLVEILGDPSTAAKYAAQTTLQKIALQCGFGANLHALFSGNMDYFVDALCMRLARLDVYPQSPQVVEALLRHATTASLPLVDEITTSLLHAVDVNQDDDHVATTLLQSLQLLLDSFAQLSDTSTEAKQPPVIAGSDDSPLTRLFLEMRTWSDSEISGGDDDSKTRTFDDAGNRTEAALPIEHTHGTEGMEEEASGVDDEDEPPLPFQTRTVEILDRCGYFVADSDPVVACLALATMEKGVRYLRSHRKLLLPLIHRLWPSWCHRLHVPNRPILIATMQLLRTVAECAGDFIGERFLESMWPSVQRLLAECTSPTRRVTTVTRAMLQISVTRDSLVERLPRSELANEARVSHEMRLIEVILNAVRAVVDHTAAVTSIVEGVMVSSVRFLDSCFPEPVVASAERLLLSLGTLNGDLVFAKLVSMAPWQPPLPPTSRFAAYQPKDSWAPSHQRSRGAVMVESDQWRLRVHSVLDRLQRRVE